MCRGMYLVTRESPVGLANSMGDDDNDEGEGMGCVCDDDNRVCVYAMAMGVCDGRMR